MATIEAVRVAGNETEVWGFGVVQHIEDAEMPVYFCYRRHEADFDLRDAAGADLCSNDDAWGNLCGGIISL